MTPFQLVLALHVGAGFSALTMFFVPMFARKGGQVHNRVGWWYTYAMWIVIITAIVLSFFRGVNGQLTPALFFSFLAVLTGRPLYFALAVLKHKRGVSRNLLRWNIGLAVLTGLTALVLLTVGLGWWLVPDGDVLLLAFGIVGIFAAVTGLNDLRTLRNDPKSWITHHIGGMLVSAIAAFTAFFAFGGRQFFAEVFTGNWQLVPWIAPTVLGTIAISYYKRVWAVKRGFRT